MIATIAKTFAVAHERDSDEHLAQALVFNAGRLAWRMREQGISVDTKKNAADVVTEADRAAEKFIATVLEIVRPEDGVYGEEGTQRHSRSGKTWVIDPVDGTYNFVSGSDYWCSAIALISGSPDNPEKLHFGAVHRPAMGYTWFGGPDIPTTRDGKKLPALTPTPPEKIALSTYLHPPLLNTHTPRDLWLFIASQFLSWRMLGSGSVDLASVADGSLGAYLQHSCPSWDWLPGKALVLGAGGKAIQLDAAGVTWSLAGNKKTVDTIAALIKENS
ncbi:inositol monophosphatase family protein [Corynebacterium kutscheri]|nr:inositol monophosphatase family protein [Corynebacterium kutscheri]